MFSKVPAGKSGDWYVEKFTVTKEQSRWDALRAQMHGEARFVPAGDYTRLCWGSITVMSDTPDELRDFSWFTKVAYGAVLINGLGLGCVVQALLDKKDVWDLTVIEKSADVIKLVAPYLADPRLKIINADAFAWQPPKGKRWDFVWHDIWNDLCTDNLQQMAKLHRKYGRRASHQDSWGKGILQDRRRHERRMGW